ncbi:molybdopterin oxidoreductase [Tropicimonas sp. IMCC6043]|nr:molybdopterin oxidoreductase [Tropicimonas sp. IMCC6043]
MSALASSVAAFGFSPAFGQVTSSTIGGANLEVTKSLCVHCVNFCGIEVHKHDGVIREIRPDPGRREIYNHGICPKGVSGAFTAYNPYRIKTPLKRTNPKKGLDQDPGWVEISWEEAFDEIIPRLEKIKAENPSKLIWQHGHGKYLIGDKFPKAFAKAFGTPNVVHRTTTCESSRHVGDDITWGYHGFLPDLAHTNLFLVFGSSYFEAEQYARWMDHAVTDARERGMKVIVIEPRLSHSGAKADRWIPIRPGKDVAMMLAMTKILIDDGVYDEEFLVTYTNAPQLVGEDGRILRDGEGQPLVWDAVSQSAKTFVEGVEPTLRGSFEVDGTPVRTAFDVFAESLSESTPEAASEICDVPAETIREIAGMIAKEARIGTTTIVDGFEHRYRPVSIHSWRGMSAKEHGVQNWRSALVLQMLLGIPDAIGGHKLGKVLDHPEYMEPAKCEYPPKRVDLAKSVYFPNGHHDVCQQVALTLLEPKAYGLEYVPELQIFYATNRPASTSETDKQYASMEKTFNVTIEVHMSETAWMSDIVLPDKSYLESWHFAPTRKHNYSSHTAIRQPVANVYSLEHDGFTILWEIAKRLGIRDEYIEQINAQWKAKEPAFEPGRDYSDKEAVEILWLNATKGKPFQEAIEKGFDGSLKTADKVYIKGLEDHMKGPGTPKMQFYADSMLGTFEKVEKVVKENGISNIDLDKYRIAYSAFPTFEHAMPTPHREATDFPFYLLTFKRMYRNQTACSNTNPILNFGIGKDTQDNGIHINPAAAKELGISDGDSITLETRIGQTHGTAKLTESIRPDTIGVAYSYGHMIAGWPQYAKLGTDVNKVLELHPDVVSGMNSFNDTKCRVIKA